MAQQSVVFIHSDPKEEAKMHETEAVFYEYVFSRARKDNALNPQECGTFEEAHQIQTTSVVRETGSSLAAIVGRILVAELEDQIDAQYQEDMQEIVQLAGSPDSAFAMFHNVVKHLFEWDEQGGAQINFGRIAALLGYCYKLCKTFISQNVAAGSLVSFIAMVAMWLFKFLIKAKFYDWLYKQGGWDHNTNMKFTTAAEKSRSGTDKDEDENRLVLLEKMGLKNARKMVPQMQRKDVEIKALVDRFEHIKSQMGDILVSMSDDQSIVVIVPTMSQNIKKLFSQPFFLEKYRYKLSLQVSMDGSGGSLSVYVHIMKGDFDSILAWPFVHRIAIKVKNQKEGDDIVHIVQPDSTVIQKPEVDQNITFGSRNFPTYSELVTEGFVQDDSISIECEVLWN